MRLAAKSTLPYLNEEEFGFPHQGPAVVAPEEGGEAPEF